MQHRTVLIILTYSPDTISTADTTVKNSQNTQQLSYLYRLMQLCCQGYHHQSENSVSYLDLYVYIPYNMHIYFYEANKILPYTIFHVQHLYSCYWFTCIKLRLQVK